MGNVMPLFQTFRQHCRPYRVTLFVSFIVGISGCSSVQQPSITTSPYTTAATQPNKPLTEFDKHSLYTLLTAELAGLQGDVDTAYQGYAEQAKYTQSVEIAKRATRVAQLNRDPSAIETSSLLWFELDPNNVEPVFIHLAVLNQHSKPSKIANFIHTNLSTLESLNFFAPFRSHIAQLAPRLAENYLGAFNLLPAQHHEVAHTTAVLHQHLGDFERAHEIIDTEIALHPNTASLIVQKIDLLVTTDQTDEARKLARNAQKNFPEHTVIGLFLVQFAFTDALEHSNKSDAVAKAIDYLDVYSPNDNQKFYVARLLFEAEAYTEARPLLESLVGSTSLRNQPQLYLGLIATQQGRVNAAIDHFKSVRLNKDIPVAAANLSFLLDTPADKADLLSWLNHARARVPSVSASLYSIEIDWLSIHGFEDEAFAIANEAIAQHPQDISLRMTRALLNAETNLEVSEQDLKEILALQPDNADALNTLGFILTTQTTRYEEALILIEKALTVAPDEPAIIDSMGWVLYKLDRLPEALEHLEQAYALDQNTEILAHLIEVHWQLGNSQRALTLLDSGLSDAPDDSYLNSVKRHIEEAS